MKIKLNNYKVVNKKGRPCDQLSFAQVSVVLPGHLSQLGLSPAERCCYYEWLLLAAGSNNPVITVLDSKPTLKIIEILRDAEWLSVLDQNSHSSPTADQQLTISYPSADPYKERKKEIEKERNKESTTNKTNLNHPLVEMWNSTDGLSKVTAVPSSRLPELKASQEEFPDNAFWQKVFKRVSASDFLTGRVKSEKYPNGWVAGFWWVIDPRRAAEIVDGKYDNRGQQGVTKLFKC